MTNVMDGSITIPDSLQLMDKSSFPMSQRGFHRTFERAIFRIHCPSLFVKLKLPGAVGQLRPVVAQLLGAWTPQSCLEAMSLGKRGQLLGMTRANNYLGRAGKYT